MSVKFKITTKTFIPVFGIAKNIQTANTWRIECLRAISVWIQKKKTKRIEKIAKHEWPSHLICCSNQLKPNQSKRKFFISNWFSLCINFDFISIPLSISLSISRPPPFFCYNNCVFCYIYMLLESFAQTKTSIIYHEFMFQNEYKNFLSSSKNAHAKRNRVVFLIYRICVWMKKTWNVAICNRNIFSGAFFITSVKRTVIFVYY